MSAEGTMTADGTIIITYRTTDERESAKMQTLMWDMKLEYSFARKMRTGVKGDGWIFEYVFTLPATNKA